MQKISAKDQIIMEKGGIEALKKEEILHKIGKIKSMNETRDAAFVSFLYLTAVRVEEVCYFILEPRKVQKKKEVITIVEQRDYVGEPLKKSDVFFYGNDKKKMEVMNVRCLKRKKKSWKVIMKRNIPIYINDLEQPFFDIFVEYHKTLKSEDYLFPFTRQRAYQILSRIGIYPHILRHTRLTDLVNYYNFSHDFLKQFTGWTSSRPADIYVHLRTDDLFSMMKSNYRDR